MAVDSTLPRSRRTVLAAAVGAGVAAVVASIGRPTPVHAGTDGDVVLGATNTATTETRISNVTDDPEDFTSSNAIHGDSIQGVGVKGSSERWYGVEGWSEGMAGVYGHGKVHGVFGKASSAGAGVYGFANTETSFGVYGVNVGSDGTGISGRAESFTGTTTGVKGEVLSPNGTGVRGLSTTGTALAGIASSPYGFALKTSGRLSFGKVSGVATIAAGKTASPVIHPDTNINDSTYVLLTPQGDPGTRRFWALLNKSTDSVTIKTNKAATSSIRIAWLLIK